MQLLGYVEKYGAMSGRVLSAREIRGMTLAANIVNAYRARAQSESWATWAQGNEAMAQVLNEAEELANVGIN